jgi:hypothetical protein
VRKLEDARRGGAAAVAQAETAGYGSSHGAPKVADASQLDFETTPVFNRTVTVADAVFARLPVETKVRLRAAAPLADKQA